VDAAKLQENNLPTIGELITPLSIRVFHIRVLAAPFAWFLIFIVRSQNFLDSANFSGMPPNSCRCSCICPNLLGTSESQGFSHSL